MESFSNIELILEDYSNKGYPFCEIKIDGIDDSLLYLRIFPHEKVYVKDIKFHGNVYTSCSILKKIISFSPFVYSDTVRERYIKYLKKAGIEVNSFSLLKDKAGYIIQFEAEEKRSNLINGIFSWQERPVGTVNAVLDNFLGCREKLNLSWVSLPQQYQKYFSRVETGWFLGLPLIIYGDVSFTSQDTTSMVFETGIGVKYPFTQKVLVFWGTRTRILKTPKIQFTRRLIEGGMESRLFNVVLNSGYEFYSVSFYGTIDYKKLNIEYMFKNIKADRIDSIELVKTGGASSVRGYYENEFTSRSVYWQRNEIFLFKILFLFYDFGLIELSNFIYSYGVGMVLENEEFKVKLSVGIPEGVLNRAKIHLRFLNEF